MSQETCRQAAAEAYFDAFVRAFATFDAAEVGRLFAVPGVALREDGTIVALTTEAELRRYYQGALDHYRGQGCRSCRWSDLAVTPMGGMSMSRR